MAADVPKRVKLSFNGDKFTELPKESVITRVKTGEVVERIPKLAFDTYGLCKRFGFKINDDTYKVLLVLEICNNETEGWEQIKINVDWPGRDTAFIASDAVLWIMTSVISEAFDCCYAESLKVLWEPFKEAYGDKKAYQYRELNLFLYTFDFAKRFSFDHLFEKD